MTSLHKRNIVFTVLVLGLASLLVFWWPQEDSVPKTFPKREKVWQTTSPNRAKDFSSIKVIGKVKSNKFAIVAPRRVGIIQDLLVDIGDQVSKGQTIGYLFPEGVEGQSSSSIAQAATQLAKARAERAEAQDVAAQSVNFAEKNLFETQTRLNNIRDHTQIGRPQIQQKHEEARTIATQSFENLKRILFGNTNFNNPNRQIVGNFANEIQEKKVITMIQTVESMEKQGLQQNHTIYTHLTHVSDLLSQAESLYKTARETRSFPQSTIEKNLASLQNEQLRMLRAKESIDDIILLSQELEASVAKSEQSLGLTESQQNQSIIRAENAVEVALANYNAALVKAGHQKILAPFDGTISERMVEVGQGVTPNTILFHMEGVPTSQTSQSAFEIHFSLPESWAGKVKSGDEVTAKRTDTGELFQAEILRLSPQINLQTGMIMATAILNPEDTSSLIHGQSLFVSLDDPSSQIFSVPTESLKKRGTDYFLWKMVDKKPSQLKVEVIAEDGEFSQIFTRELSEEDQVIHNPSVSLFRTK